MQTTLFYIIFFGETEGVFEPWDSSPLHEYDHDLKEGGVTTKQPTHPKI